MDSILNGVTKPARYTGGEWNSAVKDWKSASLRMALAYPDTYEIGMSSLALPIIYDILNRQPDVLAERVFAPWVDMETAMREAHLPLFSLETKHPLREFDVIGFSLSYELTFTNVLNMLDLAGMPVLAADRDDSYPLILAGGGAALNPEPMCDFIDLYLLGEAEEAILRLLPVLKEYKGNKAELLRHAARLPGIYVPRFYDAVYGQDGCLASLTPNNPAAKPVIQRQFVPKLPPPPTAPIVPFLEIVHDHAAIEIQRGCTRGCRFCQASTLYRPLRERPHEEVVGAVGEILKNTGYNEVALVSLSTGDYHDIEGLIKQLLTAYHDQDISLSLPSLRLDTSSLRLLEMLPARRKMTLTFAPEAGTERLRYAINKVIPEQTILETMEAASTKGGANLKLYFMTGLPTETMDDVLGIADLTGKICRIHKRPGGRPLHVRISLATLVPKPHTSCQWVAQDSQENLSNKIETLRQALRRTGTGFSWHDPQGSQIEAALSRGDRRLGKVILAAWKAGCRFDAWHEHFKLQTWKDSFTANGLAVEFYANRERSLDEVLPWEHIDTGVLKVFLRREHEYIQVGKETPDCRRDVCNVCGVQRWQEECLEKAREQAGR